jgi:hypothetical protein
MGDVDTGRGNDLMIFLLLLLSVQLTSFAGVQETTMVASKFKLSSKEWLQHRVGGMWTDDFLHNEFWDNAYGFY